MIEVYPTHVEAVKDEEPVFKLEAFDEHCATLTVPGHLVSPGSLEELFNAIRKAVDIMQLKKEDQHGQG